MLTDEAPQLIGLNLVVCCCVKVTFQCALGYGKNPEVRVCQAGTSQLGGREDTNQSHKMNDT